MLAQALRYVRGLFRPEPITWAGFFQNASAFEAEREAVGERLRRVGFATTIHRCSSCGSKFATAAGTTAEKCIRCWRGW